eukprot:2081721-Rhodomonas_salina.1
MLASVCGAADADGGLALTVGPGGAGEVLIPLNTLRSDLKHSCDAAPGEGGGGPCCREARWSHSLAGCGQHEPEHATALGEGALRLHVWPESV